MSEFSVNNRINDYAGFKARPDEMRSEGIDERQTALSPEGEERLDAGNAKASMPLSNTEFAAKALSEANVAVSERNLEMVMELAGHGMSVDKETLQMLGRDLLRSPELSVRQAVEMKQQGIEPTPMRVAFYNAITDEGWSANGALNDLLDVLSETALPKEIEDSIRQALQKDDQSEAPLNFEEPNNVLQSDSNLDAADQPMVTDLQQSVKSEPESFQLAGNQTSADEDKSSEMISSRNSTLVEGNYDSASAHRISSETKSTIGKNSSEIPGEKETGSISLKMNDGAHMEHTVQINDHSDPSNGTDTISQSEIKEPSSQLNEDKMANTIRPDAAKPERMTESETEKAGINANGNEQSTSGISDTSSADASSLTQKKESSSDSLPELLSRHFRLEPKELLKKGRISRYYREIETTMRKLSEAAKELGEKGQRLSDRAENVRESFETMRSLSDAYAFIQFPVEMSEETVNGELYVYRKKHGKKDSSEGVSVLLHLDMTNLGPTNVMIRMSHMNASLTFGLADEKSASLLKSHLPELNAILQRHGYTANCKVEQSADEKEFKTPDLPPVTASSEFKTYSFDKKA